MKKEEPLLELFALDADLSKRSHSRADAETDRPFEKIAQVHVEEAADLELWYGVPNKLLDHLSIGCRVHVSLRQRKAVGTVIDLLPPQEWIPKRTFRIKAIEGLIDQKTAFTPDLLKLADWIALYYCSSRDAVLRSMMPQAVRGEAHSHKTQRVVALEKKPTEEEWAQLTKRARRQASILREISDSSTPLPTSQFGDGAAKPLKLLADAGWIRIEDKIINRDPLSDDTFVLSKPLELNAEQAIALKQVIHAIDHPEEARPILLFGVTGSGKTEVYLQAIDHALSVGKSALVLVPEISLTPQTVQRFRSRFADSGTQIALLHSGLSQGERFDQWRLASGGQARIVIGPRSAIFAPLHELGIIVIDEEHEPSYKQDIVPRYHARDVAVVRAKMENCAILLGSATPCLESWHNVQRGKFALATLKQRVDDRKLPIIRIIDMRKEHRSKVSSGPPILSERLRTAITQRLDRGEQSILFLNRRGFATSLVCPSCGFVVECQHCSLALTFHRSNDKLVCHVCGYQKIAPRKCPSCSDPAIRLAGYGTERAEESLVAIFPKARIARVDTDTMRRKNQLRDTLAAFKAQKLDILIGTQMIAKGLHFPNVTLVGILNADISLHVGDFRAGERTFQLLTQVAGRAGRGELEGEVVVQTFTPESPSIQFARHHDFEGFADQEMHFRQHFDYPPFFHAVQILVRGPHEGEAELVCKTIHRRLLALHLKNTIIGDPCPAQLAKAADQYRFCLLLRAENPRPMIRAIQHVITGAEIRKDIAVLIDVDPMNVG